MRPPDDIHPAAAVGFHTEAGRYDRGRPSYPADAVAAFVTALAIDARTDLLELAAGTGKFTTLLVPAGARITAVEPVAAMRAVLEGNVPSARVLDGTAESIPVADRSIDAVAAAQAFHWFDAERALVEIHRVLRPGGRLGMILERPRRATRVVAAPHGDLRPASARRTPATSTERGDPRSIGATHSRRSNTGRSRTSTTRPARRSSTVSSASATSPARRLPYASGSPAR